MFKSVIELTDIIDYVGDFKRPFVEGSQIVKCNHIIEYACLENTDDRLKFVALCLKTSLFKMRSVHSGDQFSSGGGQTYGHWSDAIPTTATRRALPRNKATPMRTIWPPVPISF